MRKRNLFLGLIGGLAFLVGCAEIKFYNSELKQYCGHSLCNGHGYDSSYVKCPEVLGNEYRPLK